MDVTKRARIRRLHENISIPLAPYINIFVAQASHYAAGGASFRNVRIDMRGKSIAEQRAFNTVITYIGIPPSPDRILIFRLVAERIIASGTDILAVNKTAPASAAELGVNSSLVSME